jgi:hypothetical protein
MAESRKLYDERGYYADHQGDATNTPDNFKGMGYYRRTNLDDAVNNFIVAYVGDDKALAKVPRYEVEFWAQRGVQEFSYDILNSDKSIEIEISDALTFPLPQDYVSYIAVSRVEKNGEKVQLMHTRKSNNPIAPVQDGNYNITFDGDNDILKASESETLSKFQNPDSYNETAEQENNRYNNEDYPYSNKRYGGNPESMSNRSTFFVDKSNGIIYFDGTVKRDSTIVLDYVSDGLADNGDLTKVYIPKLAEDALYAYILYNLAKVRPTLAGIVPLYKKEASSKMRNAKIRLSNYNLPELAQVLRGKSKWIKH